MSHPTGDPRTIAKLNDLLGNELGRNHFGDPYFTWRWSEELYWPATPTGRFKTVEEKTQTPIIGAPADAHDFEEIGDNGCAPDEDQYQYSANCKHCGEPESHINHNVYSIMQHAEPEYERGRQTRKVDTWVICKWLTPWELILGPGRGHKHVIHGDQQFSDKEPESKAVLATWNRLFPGASFPARGWRVPTDAYLPATPDDENWANSPFGHTTPHLQDTEHFIRKVKYQNSRAFEAVLQDMLSKEDAKNEREQLAIGEECRDLFPAFLNPNIGKRGGFVSFPWSKKDRQIGA